MAIFLSCPSCDQSLRLPDTFTRGGAGAGHRRRSVTAAVADFGDRGPEPFGSGETVGTGPSAGGEASGVGPGWGFTPARRGLGPGALGDRSRPGGLSTLTSDPN